MRSPISIRVTFTPPPRELRGREQLETLFAALTRTGAESRDASADEIEQIKDDVDEILDGIDERSLQIMVARMCIFLVEEWRIAGRDPLEMVQRLAINLASNPDFDAQDESGIG